LGIFDLETTGLGGDNDDPEIFVCTHPQHARKSTLGVDEDAETQQWHFVRWNGY